MSEFILRPYQTDIIERVGKSKGSVLIELPTGGGKSVIAREIIRNETDLGGAALIVAPKITLLDQLSDTFADLNPQTIHGAKDYDRLHNVFVSTIQTAHRRKLGFTPSMIVIDEIHHGFTGKMIQKLLEGFKGRVIGLSATPYDRRGKPLEGFDAHLNDYDMAYLIDHGYLTPLISYRPVKVDLKGIRTTAGDYNLHDLDQRFNNLESVTQVVQATKDAISGRTQALAFGINIRHAELLADAYNAAGIEARAIHSKQNDEEKAAIMAAFKSGAVKLLANADMLTTGFDHPPTDTVILARATKSQNLYRQMVGRVLRLAPGKTEAVLLDCAGVIDELGLPTEPIKERKSRAQNVTTKSECPDCGSDRLYRKIDEDQLWRVCAACGWREEADGTLYTCEACQRVHDLNGCFKVIGSSLWLVCECGHQTKIGEASSPTELQAIFDPKLIDTIQRRFIAGYCSRLIREQGPSFIYRDEVRRQLAAIMRLIRDRPERMVGVKADELDLDEWRVIPESMEAQYLPAKPSGSVKELEVDFYAARTFTEAVERLNKLREAKGEPALKEWVVDKTREQLKDTFVDGMERMTVKRLKNLHSKGKDCNSIDTFIPYIERLRA